MYSKHYLIHAVLQLLLHVCTKTFDDNGPKARLEKSIMLLTKASEENNRSRRERVSSIFRVFFVLIDGIFCRHFACGDTNEQKDYWLHLSQQYVTEPMKTNLSAAPHDWRLYVDMIECS